MASRDLSIASTSSYPHQHQRDSPSHYDRSSYHTTSLENGWRNNGAASSRISEFSPHQHHHHHHHSQQQPSLLRSSQSLESLPRPVPVKPFTFIVPGAAAPSSSGAGPSVSGTSNLNNTTSAFTTTASTSQTNDNKNNPVNNNNNSNNNNNNNNSAIDDQGADPNKKRRGNLPKTVTSVLKSWLVQNAIHPYPTEEEKMRLSEATQLSMNQISNWFINARRRILQPILVEAAAAAVAGTDAPMDNVLIVRKGKGSRMQVEMECACVSATAQDQNHAQEHSAQDSSDQGQDQSQCQTSEGQQNEGQKQNEQDQDNE
ncbi:hypothetical protein BGZ46_007319 [Entomortierella lignicola]|nr:hypothetical protein BGZ46_007319 [Entomortierella lignicola]